MGSAVKQILKFFRIHKLRNYCYKVIHFALKHLGFLEKLGLLGFGERNSYGTNPLWMTCDVSDADHNLIFDHKSSLPICDGKVKMIYSSHNLEHLSDDIVDNFFKESSRVLKSGCELIIDVPDCQKLIDGYRKYLESSDQQFMKKMLAEAQTGDDRLLFFNDEVLDIMKKEHPEKTEEYLINYLNLPSTVISSILSCYQSPPFKSAHVPTLIGSVAFDKNVLSMTLDDLINWVSEHMDEDKKKSGGHITCWYPEKLINRLEDYGFQVELREYKTSRLFSRLVSRYIIPDRKSRFFYSFTVSAIKL